MLMIIASFPAIKGLWGDAEIATGETGIMSMGVIIVKPFKSLPGSFRWLLLKLCQTISSGSYPAYYLHSNTIISVTYLSELAQR
jgi:hypothetical protein